MFLTVIIPTYNKKNLLSKTLDYLEGQSLSKELYEVIIVNDGSSDGTDEFMKKYTAQNNSVKYYEKSHRGPGDTRNFGVRHAKGDIVVFTDDDCIIPRTWLERIYESFLKNREAIGVEGKTSTFFTMVHPLTHQVINVQGHRIFPTCNIAYKKDFLEKIGGFSNKFQYPHNEDVDLAYRLLEHGDIIFDESIFIIHPPYSRSIFKKLQWTIYFKDEFTLFDRNKKLYKKLRGKSPWTFIYFDFYVKYNLFLLKKYIKYKRFRVVALLTLEIIVFLMLQGILLFLLAFLFIYNRVKK